MLSGRVFLGRFICVLLLAFFNRWRNNWVLLAHDNAEKLVHVCFRAFLHMH